MVHMPVSAKDPTLYVFTHHGTLFLFIIRNFHVRSACYQCTVMEQFTQTDETADYI